MPRCLSDTVVSSPLSPHIESQHAPPVDEGESNGQSGVEPTAPDEAATPETPASPAIVRPFKPNQTRDAGAVLSQSDVQTALEAMYATADGETRAQLDAMYSTQWL